MCCAFTVLINLYSYSNVYSDDRGANKEELKLKILGYHGHDIPGAVDLLKLRENQQKQWIKKYGQKIYQNALDDIITNKLTDITPDVYELVVGETMKTKKKFVDYHLRYNALRKFVQIAPVGMDFMNQLMSTIESKKEWPKLRIIALQTLLRRHPTEDTKGYAFEWMKRRIKQWHQTGKGKRIAGLSTIVVDWLDSKKSYLWVKESLEKKEIDGRRISNLFSYPYDTKHIDDRIQGMNLEKCKKTLKKMTAEQEIRAEDNPKGTFIFGLNNPFIRSEWKNKRNYPVNYFVKYIDQWIENGEKIRLIKAVALLKLIDHDLPDHWQEKVRTYSDQDKKKIQFWITHMKYNLDAFKFQGR